MQQKNSSFKIRFNAKKYLTHLRSVHPPELFEHQLVGLKNSSYAAMRCAKLYRQITHKVS